MLFEGKRHIENTDKLSDVLLMYSIVEKESQDVHKLSSSSI